jgi:hypothetical protein
MNIRLVGSYEITIYDKENKRIKELISNNSLVESEAKAKALLQNTPNAESYTIASIVRNSKFNTWRVER